MIQREIIIQMEAMRANGVPLGAMRILHNVKIFPVVLIRMDSIAK